MVFVVNDSLKMGVGKIGAQIGHASIGLYRELVELKTKIASMLEQWGEDGYGFSFALLRFLLRRIFARILHVLTTIKGPATRCNFSQFYS